MTTDRFVPGSVYYQFGAAGQPAGQPVVSSWVFLGTQHSPGRSSASCDVHEHFYTFEEWNGWSAKQEFGSAAVQTLRIPSLEQACKSMLTWSDLRNALEAE